MKLDDCLDAAVAAGKLTARLAEQGKARYRELVQRYEDSGQARPMAEIMAADEAVESIVREAKARRHVTHLQLAQMQRQEAEYAGIHATDPRRIVRRLSDVEQDRRALELSFMAGIREFLAAHRTTIIGTVRNRTALMDVVRELHGQATGIPGARAMADAFRAQAERARRLFNAAGGDIGRLDDWGLPHRHDAARIRAAGFDAWFADLWTNNRIDWTRIEDFTTGKPFAATPGARPNQAVARRFLREVYDGITTDGWSDRFPSLGGGGRRSRANTRAAHRVLHFRDADAWIAYNERFGAENPFEAMIGHLRGMARDIALMRAFGPNPTAGLEHALQVETRARKLDGSLTGTRALMADSRASKLAARARTMMRLYTGEANQPASAFWARFFAGTRNLLTAAQLGGATLSSLTDWWTMRNAARAVRLNPNTATATALREVTVGMSQQQAKDLGFIYDTWFDAGSGHARFMGDIWAPEITSRITNFVLRANLLSYLTDRSRVAVAAAFGSDLADLADRPFAALPAPLRVFMQNRRVGPREWDALRSHLYTDPQGGRHVNAEWFRTTTTLPFDQAEDIALRWGAMVQAHVEMAVPTTNLEGRAVLLGGAAPGSLVGELARSSAMYKSYVATVTVNQMRRVAEIGEAGGNRWTYLGVYVIAMTVLGAFVVQIKEVAKGRDPRPMNPIDTPQFWGAALMQGGGIGIFGDFFSATASRAGGGLAETAAGPVVGLVNDLGRAVSSNVARAAEGKNVLIGRDVANLARRYNPLATFQPPIPIPTRLAMDRLIWDQLQAVLDPEAADLWRQEAGRIRREYNTQSWWARGETAPRRGPDLGNAIGGAP